MNVREALLEDKNQHRKKLFQLLNMHVLRQNILKS